MELHRIRSIYHIHRKRRRAERLLVIDWQRGRKSQHWAGDITYLKRTGGAVYVYGTRPIYIESDWVRALQKPSYGFGGGCAKYALGLEGRELGCLFHNN
jgi:hypothetical protein